MTDDEPTPDNRTAIERVLGRTILKDPPNLHDWIKRFGGYALITPEGWAYYDRAMADWREQQQKPTTTQGRP